MEFSTNPNHTILQGATFDEGDSFYTIPFPIRYDCGWVRKDTGAPVVLVPVTEGGDLVPRDFSGCEARMQLRIEPTSPFILDEFTTAEGSIAFDGPRVYYPLDADRTAAMKYGDRPDRGEWSFAMGHLEIVHPGGRIERLATINWWLDPEGTR